MTKEQNRRKREYEKTKFKYQTVCFKIEELEEILGKDYDHEAAKKLLEEAVDKINDNSPVFKKIRKVMIRKTDFVKNASKKLIRFAPENKETE